ncbi:MAG: FKBP-type peptidyl-prolyl cis-trans isomerase [Oleibacter sp.]|nr:FKBP-type peptidyl-prolyl cis-trans isomerase [Thalassolituus sp.]
MFKTILIIAIVVLVIYALRRAGVGLGGASSAENEAKALEFLNDNRTLIDVIETQSGLQYQVLTEGSGETHPNASDRVTVHYHGTLIDGNVFDSSVDRGEPITFGLNQVIAGWTEGVQLMTEGAKYRFFIPPALGYGNRKTGSIPAGSVLIFDVELIKIN